jgi:hypothetical protein
MRRSLVLTDESARHPFRASLPPHAREYRVEARAPWRAQIWRDAHGFAQTYCACFLAVSAFLY